MTQRDLVVVGASAGGLEALREIVAGFPADLRATVLIVLHLPASATSYLPTILGKASKLRVVQAVHGAPLEPGTIHVAPPDHHLLVHGNALRLSRGPKVNGHRPAVDALFLSAARWMGPRTIAVVLSGSLDDGTAGARHVLRAGGVTIAQDPLDALYPSMPRSAIEAGGIQLVQPVARIVEAIVSATGEEVMAAPPESGSQKEDRPDRFDDVDAMLAFEPVGDATPVASASGFTCPDCHGALWEVTEDQLVRYRCRIGHSFAPKSLFNAQSEKIEEAMWAGYRALAESAALALRLATRAEEQGLPAIAARWRTKYDEAMERATTLQSVLEGGQLATEESP